MKRLRVLLLLHPDFRPERKTTAKSTEAGLVEILKGLGHSVEVCLLDGDLRRLQADCDRFEPDLVFNLMEEFRGEGIFDFHPVSWVEGSGFCFTGCNPRGLVNSRNKRMALAVAGTLGVGVPKSFLVPTKGPIKIPAGFQFPLFVKLNREHASMGITSANRVVNAKALKLVCSRLRKTFGVEILVQEFIEGQDVSVAVWGNAKPVAMDPWELVLSDGRKFATEKLKFSPKYRSRRGIAARKFSGPGASQLKQSAVRVFEALDLNGYARMDFRVAGKGKAYLVDVNANPNIAPSEDFADAAAAAGYTYPKMIQKILKLGLEYEPNK